MRDDPERDLTPVTPRLAADADALLSELGHDLGSPLTFLVGYSEMLATGQLRGPAADEASVEIYREACRMADLVAALLETTRARLGASLPDPTPVDLSDLLSCVEQRWRRARPDVALAIACPKECALEADADRLTVALNVLIGLAAGVAQDGPGRAVVLRVEPDPTGPERGLTIRVTGPGSPANPASALARDAVAAIAAGHGGAFRAGARAFELSLPRAAARRSAVTAARGAP
jgi:signal transduction histidine kinase